MNETLGESRMYMYYSVCIIIFVKNNFCVFSMFKHIFTPIKTNYGIVNRIAAQGQRILEQRQWVKRLINLAPYLSLLVPLIESCNGGPSASCYAIYPKKAKVVLASQVLLLMEVEMQ